MRIGFPIALLLVACQPAPAGGVPVVCHGIPEAMCDGTDWLEGTAWDRNRGRVAEVRVTCVGSCGASGEASVTILLDNGAETGYAYGWDGSLAPSASDP